ncbi:WD40-repeat-containing domain protein [Dichotomocladium elegans]|nr:WD40-repeat-containing domain protein [Dichotomocladium elegans]
MCLIEFALFCLQRIPPGLARRVIDQITPLLHRDFISQLPNELALRILGFLDALSLARVATISRHWKEVSSDQVLWRRLFQSEGWGYDQDAMDRYLAHSPATLASRSTPLVSSLVKRRITATSRSSDESLSTSTSSSSNDPLRPTLAPIPLSRTAPRPSPPSNSSRPPFRRTRDLLLRLQSRHTLNQENNIVPDTNIPRPSSNVAPTAAASPTSPSRSQPLLSLRTGPTQAAIRGSISANPRPQNLTLSSATSNAIADHYLRNRPSPRRHAKHDEAAFFHYDDKTDTRFINWHRLYRNRFLIDRRWREGKCKMRVFPPEEAQCDMHLEAIYCIQFDDDKIVSGSRDRTIKIWDMQTGECRKTLMAHSASVLCLQYDDRYIFSGSSDATIIQWDIRTGSVIRVLYGHTESVLNLKFSGNRLVSCSKDRTVRIWDLETGKTLRTLRGHRAAVNAVQFDGNRIVSASGDRTIKLWDMETGQCIRTFDSHSRGIACVEFDNERIVSGSSDQTIKIWDAATGRCLHTLAGHTDLVRTLQMNPISDRIISGSYDGSLRIWSLSQGKHLRSLSQAIDGRVLNLQYDYARIVCCSNLAKIVKYDFSHGIDTQFLK